MSFEKKTNLSSRTTARRRIQEEVKNNFIITPDTSSLLGIIPELNSNLNTSQSQIGDPLPELSADYLNVNYVDIINYNNSRSQTRTVPQMKVVLIMMNYQILNYYYYHYF